MANDGASIKSECESGKWKRERRLKYVYRSVNINKSFNDRTSSKLIIKIAAAYNGSMFHFWSSINIYLSINR